MYYVIIELSAINGKTVSEPVGYATDEATAETLCTGCMDFCNWIEANKTDLENEVLNSGDYFDNNPNIRQIGWVTDCIEGLDLNEL